MIGGACWISCFLEQNMFDIWVPGFGRLRFDPPVHKYAVHFHFFVLQVNMWDCYLDCMSGEP